MDTEERAKDGLPRGDRYVEAIKEALSLEREDPRFSDVVVIVEEKEFKCHRVLLARMSEFFNGLFNSGMKEAMDGRITIHEISHEVFDKLLRWMYHGEPILTKENVFLVLQAADRLIINFLIEHCKEFLATNMSTDICVRVYKTANTYCWTELAEAAWNFLLGNFVDLTFSELDYLSIEDMRGLLSSSQLIAESEDLVLSKILSWVGSCANLHSTKLSQSDDTNNEVERNESDELGNRAEDENIINKHDSALQEPGASGAQSRTKYLAELMGLSRYLLVSTGFLWNILLTNDLVQSDPRCQKLVWEIGRFQAKPDTHQHSVPTAAIHRMTGKKRDVLIRVVDQQIHYQIVDEPLDNVWRLIDIDLEDNTAPHVMTQILAFLNDTILIENYNCTWRSHFGPNMSTTNTSCLYNVRYKRNCIRTIQLKGHYHTVDVFPIGNDFIKLMKTVDTLSESTYTICKLRSEHCVHSKNWKVCDCLSKCKNDLACAAAIDCALILMWRHPEISGLSVQRYDVIKQSSFNLVETIPSTAGAVTFWKDDQLFFLQMEGVVWSVQRLPEAPYLSLHRESHQLWSGQHDLTGAVLVADQLIVFTETTTEIKFCETNSTHGIFSFINKLTCQYSPTRPIHAVVNSSCLTTHEYDSDMMRTCKWTVQKGQQGFAFLVRSVR